MATAGGAPFDVVLVHSFSRFARDHFALELVRRYEATTGNPTVLIETGEAFDVLAARRSREAAPV